MFRSFLVIILSPLRLYCVGGRNSRVGGGNPRESTSIYHGHPLADVAGRGPGRR